MRFVFAPMEGITGYVFRNVRQQFYQDVEAYYSPFISPDEHHFCNTKDLRDIMPENNHGITLIPQVMTNRSEYFIRSAKGLAELGYNEVNLNLGCPSGTVFNKHRGAGMLKDPEELCRFLDEIFSSVPVKVSVKTRLGVADPEEFYMLLDIYNRFPLHKLIIHPRVRSEFYKGKPHHEMYGEAVKRSRAPLVYNGNIFSVRDYRELITLFPDTTEIMVGRGLIANPGLLLEITTGQEMDRQRLRAFHDALFVSYKENCPGPRPLLFKMKEQWYYMASLFPEGQKVIKKLRKAGRVEDYLAAVDTLFSEYEIDTSIGFSFM